MEKAEESQARGTLTPEAEGLTKLNGHCRNIRVWACVLELICMCASQSIVDCW